MAAKDVALRLCNCGTYTNLTEAYSSHAMRSCIHLYTYGVRRFERPHPRLRKITSRISVARMDGSGQVSTKNLYILTTYFTVQSSVPDRICVLCFWLHDDDPVCCLSISPIIFSTPREFKKGSLELLNHSSQPYCGECISSELLNLGAVVLLLIILFRCRRQ